MPHTLDDPILICGSGIAGCLLALHVARAGGTVQIVTKERLGAGSTRRAQGGIAAAIGAGDSVAAHVRDTLEAGAGLCDPEAVRAVCAYGPACVAELSGMGVRFDGDGGRPALGLEGAHSAPRIVHAGGDATGHNVVEALVIAVHTHPLIRIAEGETAIEILVRDGRAFGLRSLGPDGTERVRQGRAVALATGGMGHLFAHTTNPPGATADGLALAARAGAALVDLEMVQFHPTALALGDGPRALVSEAVRGAGAVLRDRRGRRFIDGSGGLDELGPRDAVARAIYRQARADGVDPVLDLSHLDPADVHRRFPTISAVCAEHGLDLARDPIPVSPAAHYAMGGVLTDIAGRSTLPGLLALGECASTGAHGANRLASNGLLEAAFMARRGADALMSRGAAWPEGPVATARRAPRIADLGAARGALQTAMWTGAGLERDAGSIAGARRIVREIEPDDLETANLALIGDRLLASAGLRTESRGAHFRSDHPSTDPGQARRIAWVGDEPVLLGTAGTHATRRAA